MPSILYIERALFVVGEPNDGKSTQLRSLFSDRRFGTDGKVPTDRRLQETYRLSHDRGLYLRLTSPHESKESPKEFFGKIRSKTGTGRWAVASPLQPDARHKMPDLVETVRLFTAAFEPERIRICFLSPSHSGEEYEGDIQATFDSLWKIDGVECIMLDARTRAKNGLIYADFFDYS